MKSLMHTLSKSKCTKFRQNIHKFLLGISRNDVYNVETFNAIFNAKACELLKHTELSKRNVSLDNNNSKKKIRNPLQLTPEAIATGAVSSTNLLVDSDTNKNITPIKINHTASQMHSR